MTLPYMFDSASAFDQDIGSWNTDMSTLYHTKNTIEMLHN